MNSEGREQRYAAELRTVVGATKARLEKVTDADAARHLAPDKWSPKEIIGHLIDSASNNHQRFIRAQSQEDLIFATYDQDEWVRAQRYADRSWKELLTLWHSFNVHLAHVMETMPVEARTRLRRTHNFQRIAFRQVAEADSVTLDWFMEDYVEHLKHHLAQIEAGRRQG